VRLASARSRRFAWLRPRCARLAALTAPSANLVRQLSTAQVNGDDIQSAHRFTNLLTTRCDSAIVEFSSTVATRSPLHIARCEANESAASGHDSFSLSIHLLVDHSRDDTSADHALAPDVRCGPGYSGGSATRRSRMHSIRAARTSPIFSRESSSCHGHSPVSCRRARSRTQCCPTTAERVREPASTFKMGGRIMAERRGSRRPRRRREVRRVRTDAYSETGARLDDQLRGFVRLLARRAAREVFDAEIKRRSESLR